ncbi:hypothetical protein NPIL_304461 [Nephila pilipes]|uniref:Uncharacterized protein n=1 Tax=Nephila pilipes TaxID=299642 RepID=A0A8X6U9L9_NEPPI|nr:hypothetical protein NPIL_304461 [Nephila pilipes]
MLTRKRGEINSPRNKNKKSAEKLGGINQRRARKSPREEAERPERRKRSPGREKQKEETEDTRSRSRKGVEMVTKATVHKAPCREEDETKVKKWNMRFRI